MKKSTFLYFIIVSVLIFNTGCRAQKQIREQTGSEVSSPANKPVKYTEFKPGAFWYDHKGEVINAHGGGLLYRNKTYYWFGETRGRSASRGVNVYSSKDLYNWKNEGLTLAQEKDTLSDIIVGSVMERPKVIYNEKTKNYIMWFHLELKGKGYSAARAGVAVSDKPTGPYKFLKSFRPNEYMSRDMGLFVDDDGSAYHIYSSKENYDLRIAKLTDVGITLLNLSSFGQTSTDTTVAPPAVLPGVYADPHIAVFENKFYIYPTTDGTVGWKSTNFTCWSSDNLINWKNEGIILDLAKDLNWAKERAWAPAIVQKNGKYYYYYSADVNIGVAVSDKPTAPFKDPLGKPLIAKGTLRGQMIDPMVFIDDDRAAYLFFGQGNCNVVKLNEDMISYDSTKIISFKPQGYNEGSFVFKRKGKYYLMWSEYDTRDPRYSIAYATAYFPLGPYIKAQNIVLKGKGVVKGAGHHSVVKVPGKDEWYIAYHRFKIPGGNGYNRETCISSMRFDERGNILPVDVFEKIKPVTISNKKLRGKRSSK